MRDEIDGGIISFTIPLLHIFQAGSKSVVDRSIDFVFKKVFP